MDTLRKFVITYPRWSDFNIRPGRGQEFEDFEQIAIDWFNTADNISQLALQFIGADIVRRATEPIWSEDIQGRRTITRQANFQLLLLQFASTSRERIDTSEFLFDFVSWMDERSINNEIPPFGDDPTIERTWATSGTPLAEWDVKTKKASVYLVMLHKIYAVTYPPTFNAPKRI